MVRSWQLGNLVIGEHTQVAQLPDRQIASQDAEKLILAQAVQKGPDARRNVMSRVRRAGGTPQRALKRFNAADGPF
jgi:hypothetical protein